MMWLRLSPLIALMLVAATLGGCSRCGSIWDEWGSKPKSCHSDAAPQ